MCSKHQERIFVLFHSFGNSGQRWFMLSFGSVTASHREGWEKTRPSAVALTASAERPSSPPSRRSHVHPAPLSLWPVPRKRRHLSPPALYPHDAPKGRNLCNTCLPEGTKNGGRPLGPCSCCASHRSRSLCLCDATNSPDSWGNISLEQHQRI